MNPSRDVDAILQGWPYRPGAISARRVTAGDGREVLQLRIELGVLQLETSGRPDGTRPHGSATYLDWLRAQVHRRKEAFQLTAAHCLEMDREFLQYYHRRICWLALRDFARAVRDADHTLALMDFAREHSADADWIASHEQYRGYVLFHRTQAAALGELELAGAEAAIEQIDQGLLRMEQVRGEGEVEDADEQDEQIAQLVGLKQWLREQYDVGQSLEEQLADAVANEDYERAAQLRDQIAEGRPKAKRRRKGGQSSSRGREGS